MLADGEGGFGFPEGEEYMFGMLPLFRADHRRRCLQLQKVKKKKNWLKKGKFENVQNDLAAVEPVQQITNATKTLKGLKSILWHESMNLD